MVQQPTDLPETQCSEMEGADALKLMLEDVDLEGSIQDDPMLVDFHLGNAINLDVVEFLVSGKRPEYNLYVPRFQRESWDELRRIVPIGHRLEVGLLNITTQLLLAPVSKWTNLTPRVWKEITKVIVRGLKDRNIQIPIVTNEDALEAISQTVPESWLFMFNMILSIISSLSELVRGGTKLPYAAVWKRGNVVLCNLLPGTSLVLAANRNMIAIMDHKAKCTYVGNYDSLLLLMDTLGQRMCALIGLQVATPYKVGGCFEIETLMEILRAGDHILYYGGNRAYEIIAMFEALVVSLILRKNPDHIADGNEFYQNCVSEVIESCDGIDNQAEILDHVHWMITKLKDIPSDALSNVFCLYRIWGHPNVDIHAGMKKVYDKATFEKVSMNISEGIVLCQFRHMFLRSYLAKHHQYPTLTIEGNGYVQTNLRRGYVVDHKDAGFVLLDYLGVKIEQIWTVPETYDICHILNDKAISPGRAELFDSVSKGRGTVMGTMRRGIIKWMEGESIRCKEFLDHVDAHGLDQDDLIIGMYEKEREIKVKARMFSLMSDKMRMYIVLTEELIANHILPYFPEITMKDPLNVQIRKIWKVGGAGQSTYNPNINIDFEKWNLNMRREFTSGLFQQMDTMFGFSNLILRTHDIFFNSYVYSCSGKYNPPVGPTGFLPDPPMAYIGHLGGFEGLRQKGWTIATVCLLAYTAWQLKIDAQLLGQGDNQVVKLYMPIRRWDNLCYTPEARQRESRRLTVEYLQKMRANFTDAGLPIKVRETWISTRLFMYGKSMYVDGNCLSQWLKKLLRSYALSNEGSVTISGVIGTIATNMSASAGVSDSPDVMYLIYLLLGEWSLEYLLHYHPFTRKRTIQGAIKDVNIPGCKRTYKTPPIAIHRLVVSLLTVPTAVGGSVTVPLTGFIFRGFPDHSSEGYAWLNMLRMVPSQYQDLFRNWYSFLKNDTIQYDMLVQSPWSLNHLKPPTPGLQSRDMIRDWLLSGRFGRNKFLANMALINQTFDRKSICKELMSDPINPLITYEVFNAFPQSYYDSILRRFEGTRSVRKLAMRERYTRPIVRRLMEVEEQYMYYICWRGETLGEIFSDCATAQTRNARDIGWERTIHGLTTPHPLEFAFDSICQGYDPACDHSDYVLVRHDENGDYPPYLGSRVRTKVISLQDEGARYEPLICANARLARYLKWLQLGDNLINVVRMSTEALCDTDVFDNFYDVTPGAEGYTGCTEHRFNPAAASDGCFINYVPQLGARVYMSGDYMPRFGKGKENYTIHFQALYCFLQYTSARDSQKTARHHHLRCTECIIPCDDTIADINIDHPAISRAFSAEINLVLRQTIGFINVRPVGHVTGKEYLTADTEVPFHEVDLSKTGCYYGLLYTLASKCVYAILSKGDDEDLMGLVDMQSFPRVYCYKLHLDHLMEAVCNILLYAFLMRSKESVDSIGLLRAKKSLLRYLDRAPLTKFKELASLCVGRGAKSHHIQFMIPTGAFPEDATLFVRGVKGCLIDVVMENGKFIMNYPQQMYIPKLSVTKREYQMLLGMNGIIRYSCHPCGELLWNEQSTLPPSCRSGHLPKLLSQVVLTFASLDKMSKVLTIKSRVRSSVRYQFPVLQSYLLPSSEWEDYYMSPEIMDAYTTMARIARPLRRINLPTASIYKWTAVLSNLPREYDFVIVLGDGTGGTSYLASQYFSNSIIYPLAKFERYRMIPQDSESIHPFLSRRFSNVCYDLIDMMPDDILYDSWVSEISLTIDNMTGSGLLLSDIEGVDGNLVLDKVVSVHHKTLINIVVKAYLHEIDSRFLENELTTCICTLHGNFEYYEGFLTNIQCSMRSVESPDDLLKEQRLVEITFQDPLDLSWILMRHRLSQLGISIGKRVLLGDPGILMVLTMAYINSRYRFPQDKIRAYDPRNLTDGVLMRLVRLMKILILSFVTDEVVDQEWFKGITLAHATKENRDRRIITKRINLVTYSQHEVKLFHEDYLVARTIRGFRQTTLHIQSFPQLLSLIIAYESRHLSSELLDMMQESDSISEASDLSYS